MKNTQDNITSSKSHQRRCTLRDWLGWINVRTRFLLEVNERVKVILIAWGSASWKSEIVTRHIEQTFKGKIAKITMDDYYFWKTYMQDQARKWRHLSWDEPGALDLELLNKHAKELKAGKVIEKPIYSMKLSERCEMEKIEPNHIILIEWLFPLASPMYETWDLNIFVESDTEVRLSRRIARDTLRTWQTPLEIEEYFRNTVEPMHARHIEPTKINAHLIIENN